MSLVYYTHRKLSLANEAHVNQAEALDVLRQNLTTIRFNVRVVTEFWTCVDGAVPGLVDVSDWLDVGV